MMIIMIKIKNDNNSREDIHGIKNKLQQLTPLNTVKSIINCFGAPRDWAHFYHLNDDHVTLSS